MHPPPASEAIPQGTPPANRAELLSASLTEENLFGGQFTAQAFFSRTRDIFGGSITGTFQDASIAPLGTLFDQSVNNSRKLGAKLGYERTLPGFDDLTADLGPRPAPRPHRADASGDRPDLGAANRASSASRRSCRATSSCSTASSASPAASAMRT